MIRTPNLPLWRRTRYRCANPPFLNFLVQDALKYIWQLSKNGYVARKQKRNDKKEINKKIEYIEKKQDEEWKYHNSRISKVLEQFENFKYNWKAKIPNSCSRIKFLCEYIEFS